MQRFKILGLVLMAVFALSAVVSATASAELPVILTKAKVVAGAVKFKGTNTTTTKLVKLNGSEVSCSGNTVEGEFEAKKPLGLFHIHFTGCKGPLATTCTGLSDAAGTILALGTIHIVYDKLGTGTELGAAVLFLIELLHFSCSIVLILVKGELLCLITPINKLATVFTTKCEQEKAGDPKEVVYWNDEGKEVNIKEGLLASESDGTFEMSSQVGEGAITTAEEVEIMA